MLYYQHMETPQRFSVPSTPEGMKSYFDRQKKREVPKETPQQKEGRGDSVDRSNGHEMGPDMNGFLQRMQTLEASIRDSRRSTRGSVDEEAAADVMRFLREHTEAMAAVKERPHGLVRFLRELNTQLRDPALLEKLPRGPALQKYVADALGKFE